MHALVAARREQIAALCRQYGVARLELFGSAARAAGFDPARSDIDLLVEFEPEADRDLGRLPELAEALAHLFGRPVDLVERRAVEESRNYLRRRRILTEAEPVYGG